MNKLVIRRAVARAIAAVGLGALASSLLSKTALASTPFTSFSFLATGASTPRSDPDRWADIFNVKDYGAKGDNTTDDYAAIQACFDAAFGPASSPHGNGGGYRNRAVYFPAGRYVVRTPLSVTAVWGGRIFGDGILSSSITFTGTIAPVSAEGWCPTLWLNGCNYTTIQGLSFSGPSDTTNHSTVCIWWGPDGANGGSSAHGNTIINIFTQNTSYGIIHGSTNSAANSENTYIGCNLNIHEIGMYLSGGNTLNFRMIGGGATTCSVAGIKTNNNATVPILENVAFDQNFCDVVLAAAGTAVLNGVRTESASFVQATSAIVMNCCIQNCIGGTVTASEAATTFSIVGSIAPNAPTGAILTVTSINSGTIQPTSIISGTGVTANSVVTSQLTGTPGGIGTYAVNLSQTVSAGTTISGTYGVLTVSNAGATIIRPGMVVYGSDGTNSLPASGLVQPTRVLSQLSGTPSGAGTYLLSATGTPGNISSTTFTVRPVFLNQIGASLATVIGCGSPYDAVLMGSNNSLLRVKNNAFLDQPLPGLSPDLLKFYFGSIPEYDVDCLGANVVANLPSTGLSSFKGCRMFVTDSNAAMTGNFGAVVAGSGSNAVPVTCDGTNWRIG